MPHLIGSSRLRFQGRLSFVGGFLGGLFYGEDKDAEMSIRRTLLFLCILLGPPWSFLFRLSPTAHDALGERLAMSLALGVVVWLSFLNLARATFEGIFAVAALIFTLHCYSFVTRNGFSAPYCVGMVMIVVGVAGALTSTRQLVAYGLFVGVLPALYPFSGFWHERFILSLGLTTGLMVMSLNIVTRNRLIASVRERELRLRRLSECNTEGILVLDANRITDLNHAAQVLFGRAPHEMLGRHWSDFLASRERNASQKAGTSSFADAAPLTSPPHDQTFEAIGRRADGTTVPLEVVVKSCLWEDRSVSVANVHDISDRKKAERIIAEQQLTLMNSSNMLAFGEMAASLAHEINNPLTIISGKAWELRALAQESRLTTDLVLDSANKIEQTAMRVSRLIKGLRAFAREGTHDPVETVLVKDLLSDCTALCGRRLSQAGVTLRVTPFPETLTVEGRAVQLMQVLLNLLNNAADAAQETLGKWVQIDITSDFENGSEMVEIRMTDSGPGIPPALVERIFLPFFTTKAPGKGTGMGLSICQGIIETHQGTLVLNRDSFHTQFICRFPRLSSTPAQQDELKAQEEGEADERSLRERSASVLRELRKGA